MKNFYAALLKISANRYGFVVTLFLAIAMSFQPGQLFAQPPAISYSSPQNYTINVAITALSPSGSGVAAVGHVSVPVAIGAGFSNPAGLAVDASGNIYIADEGNSLVKKMPAGGGTPGSIGTGFNHPYGVAVDAAGNVYVADEGNNAVKEILASNGSTTSIGSGFSNPSGVAVDAAGNVYVADYGNNAVKKIPAGNGTPVAMGSGFSTPTGVAVDAAGNVYVADYGHSAIKEILISNGSTATIGSGFTAPAGVAIDASGNLYIADTGNSLVKELPAGGGSQVTLGSGFSSPYGIAVDGAGNVYAADESQNAVKEIKPAGGYYISSALPLGLNFNNSTGAVNGTPTVLSAAKNYVVTAYNSTASAQATVNIAVNPPPLPTIHYSSPQVYTTSVAITTLAPTTTGTINSFSINPALPAGLSFNTSTGAISGTPTGTSAATNYTVTAQNPGGTVTANINITVNYPPRPTISYGGAQTYLVGAAIAPLTPASTWVSAPGYKSAVSLSASFSNPAGVAADAAGNVYVADKGSGSIKKISADGTTFSTIASGFSFPYGIAVDTKGNVYVSDSNNNVVYEITPGGSPAVIASGFSNPGALAVDAAGNVYVSDENNRAVKKIPAGGGSPITLASGFVFPKGLAVDPLGNVYVAVSDLYNNPIQNAVYKIPVDGGPLSLFIDYGLGTNEWGDPLGVALDGNGNFYMSDQLYDYVLKYPSTGGSTGSAVRLPASTDDEPSVAVGGTGTVYVSYYFDNIVQVIQPFGGYFITPALPPGMHFDGTTGTISGTPSAPSAATTYTITGYNVGGGTSTTVTIGVNAPPLPAVSYNGPSDYLAGRAIPALTPASANVDVQGYNVSTPVDVGSGFSKPAGLGTDLAGNIYVADAANNAVKKMPAGGGTPVIIGSGFSNPYGVTTDAAGNIYIADKGNNAVKKLPVGGGIPQIIGSGFSSPEGVAVDASGNVYVADAGNNAIKKILAAGGTPVNIGGGFNAPAGISVDGSGNVFVADAGNNAVKEILAVGGSTVTLRSGFNHPAGVAVDGSGDVFVADASNNQVKEIPAGGGAIVILAVLGPGFNDPDGITIDAAGNVYVADSGNNAIVKFKPVGGYFVSPFLPAGFTINASTGVVSGVPVAAAAAATYTVTAWNFTGSNSTSIRFSVDPISSPPTLNYGAPQTATATVPIVPFSPSATNIGNYGYNINYAVTIGSGLVNPAAVAADPQGNIYIGDDQARINGQPGIVYEEPADGSGQVTFDSGLADPTGLAATAGNLYISDTGNLEIFEGDSPYGTSPELSYIGPVAADGAGNVYTFNPGFNTLYKLPPDLSGESPFGSGLNSPVGIVADLAGNVYVSDAGNNDIVRFNPDGSGPYTVASVSNPGAITLDAAGNIYVADNQGSLFVVFAGTNYATLIASGLKNASSIAIDYAGNIFWADTGAHLVYKMAPVGGYFLSAPLPAGLIFSNINGSVSGTPAVVSPAANYTVTAYNTGGSITATFSLAVNPLPPPPSISYNGPQTYTVNATIAPLSPVTNNTVAALAYRPFTASIGSGVVNPVGVAVDPRGNIYIADDAASVNATSGRVYMEAANGGGQSILVDSASDPTSVATDAAGDLFISDTGLIQIFEIPAGQSNITTSSPELENTGPIAADGTGNVYTFSPGGGAIYKLSSDLSGESLFASGLNSPVAIAADYAGNVYVSDAGNNDIVEFAPNGTGPVKLGTITNPGPLAIDPAGNVYVLDKQGNLYTITIGTNSPVQIGSGFTNASSLVIDYSGNIYYTDISSHLLKKVVPAGGYFLNTPLPAGLMLPNTTGIISGTPTAISAAANYTVTAYNIAGATAATVNIGIVPPSPTLSSLQVSAGTLNPAFAAATTNYNAAVANGITSMTITPTTADPTATITVNGTAVTSGSPSQSLPLAVGPNTLTTVVTAQDGVTKQTYKIVVTEAKSANANLASFKPNTGTLSPTFTASTTGYTESVNYAVSTITVTPTTADPAATVTVNGTAVTSGTATAPIGLTVGTNTITTVVTAQNGTTKTYIITVTRGAAATVVSLSGLTISSGTLAPAFVNTTTAYTASVPNATTFITVTPTASSLYATITVNGTAVASGSPSQNLPLLVGPNAINMVVTAQNGTTIKTYTVTVTRAASSNDNLSNITLSNGILNPVFATATTSYTAVVASGIASMTITPTTADPTATITVNGTAVSSGTTSQSLPLAVGVNTITTVVTAQDGVTKQTYTLAITRLAPANANLSLLKPGTGSLSPTFTASTTTYTESVNYDVSTITVTPTTADPAATVTVNGTAVTSGTASAPINLTVGTNTITTIVTAQNGTTKTYTLTVTRTAAAAVASLSGLTISSGTLAPAFVNTTTAYTASVSNAITSITVTPTASSTYATITVNGTAVTSGTASAPVNLNVGANIINTVVTAQNGTTIKTYTITITRAKSSNDNLASLTVSSGTLTPAFAAATTNYTTAVGNGLTSMTITPTTADPTATITVNGTAVTSGIASQSLPLAVGPNTLTTVVTAQDGVTKQTYTIVVSEAKSSNDNLSAFKPGTGNLTPIFAAATTSYTENVPNAVSTITISPITAVTTSTVTINGTAVTSGTASTPIALSVGANTITGIVTAQNGATKTYTLTVTRAAGGADSYDPGISVTKPTETPTLANDGILVHQAVSPNGDGINDFLQIDNISLYPNNKLSIMNRNGQLIYEASGYDNSSKVFDGHSNKNGQMQLPGTYFYQLDYTVNGITKHKTGFLVLKY